MSKLSSLSLKTKITMTVLLLFLCSIWMLTFFISTLLQQEMTAQIEAQQFSTASYIADSIEKQVKLRFSLLTAVASLITPELIANPGKLREFLHGRTSLLTVFQLGLTVLSKEGKVIADYPVVPGRTGGSLSDREYFRDVVASGKPAVGKPALGRFSRKPIIGFAVPVLARSGQLTGVLAGYTLLSDPTLLGTIESSAYKDFPDRFLVGSRKYHMYITGSDPTRILEPRPAYGVNPLLDRVEAGFEGSGITVNSRGVRILISAKHIPTPGWFIRVGLPTEMAFAPISSMKQWAYSIALGMSLISSFLVWLIIKQALHPLYTASRLIQDITEERLPLQNIPVTRHDEVGQLLTSYNLHLSYRKDTEEELKRISQHNQVLLNSTGDGILGLDLEGKHTFVNPAAASMLGYTVEELLGRESHSLWHHTKADGSPYPEHECPIYAAYRKGVVSHSIGNEVFWRKDGSRFRVAYTSTPILKDNMIVGAVLTFLDITEQMKLEAQLVQAQKMESIGLLAGGIAHDLSNIFGAIIGFTSLLQIQIQKEDHPAREYLDHIPALTDRATTLIRDLMAFSRKQVLDIKPASLNDIVNTAAKLLSRVIGEHIKLNLKLLTEDMVINADSVQIEQALMNLATNARDSMPEGGTLTISTGPFEMNNTFINKYGYGKAGKYALLSVEDTGTGIDEETRKKIFEPFFTTKGVGKGTGLGLAMVYGTIKQHDGYINVYSEVGKGTIFSIYLPAIDTEAAKAKSMDNIPLRGGTETILLVEDEASLRQATGTLLKEFGYKVIDAEDGIDAVNKFSEQYNQIDLVLMDVIMPGKSGKDAYKEMQNIQPDVRIIFTSGHAGDILTSKKLLEEGLHFIPKPISTRELLDKMRDVLDKTNH